MYKRYPVARAAPATRRTARKRDPPHRARRTRRWTLLLAAAIALVGAIIAAWTLLAPTTAESTWYDDDAGAGSYEGKSDEEVKADLEKTIAEGMMNISIASNITVSAQTGQAEARIENIAANKVDQKVTLELADTGEVIYESGAIAPGSHVQTIQLDANLEPGVYGALATFDGYDIETREKKGTAAAKVTLAVEP